MLLQTNIPPSTLDHISATREQHRHQAFRIVTLQFIHVHRMAPMGLHILRMAMHVNRQLRQLILLILLTTPILTIAQSIEKSITVNQ